MRLGIFLLLFALNLIPSFGEGGTRGEGENELLARLEIDPAEVGQPSQIRWSLSERKSGNPVSSRLTLTITHLEEGRQVFLLDSIPANGDFTLQFHFTDGSPYRVTSVAHVDGREPIQEEQTITVTGKEPPREAIFPSLFFFLVVIALGLATGRISRSRQLLTFIRARPLSHEQRSKH